MEEGDTASLLVQDLLNRTGASGENVSPPTTGLQKKVNNGQAFPQEILSLFLNKPIAGTLKACL